MRLGRQEKVIRETNKARTLYVMGVLISLVASMGVIYFAKIFSDRILMLDNSFRARLIISAAALLLGSFFTFGALIFARKSRESFVLTNRRIICFGIKEKDEWEIDIEKVKDCQLVASWFEQMFGCCKLLLILENTKGLDNTICVGPFSRIVARDWKTEISRMINLH